MNKFSEKCLAKAQELVDKKGSQWVSGIACGNFITPSGEIGEGGYNDGSTGMVCHAFVTSYQGDHKEPFLFVNVMKSKRMANGGDAEERAFVEYICQWSPVRNFIINCDKIDELMNGGVVIDCLAAGSAVTLWICKTLRILYEEKYRRPLWTEMVKAGVHPMLALNFAMCATVDLRDQRQTTHNSSMLPVSKRDIPALLVDHLPDAGEWKTGSDTRQVFPVDKKGRATYGGYGSGWNENHDLPLSKEGGRKIKVPDGWGGYTEKTEAADIDSMAKAMLELQKEFV